MTHAANNELYKLLPAPAVYVRLLLNSFARTPHDRQRLLAGTEVDEAHLQKADACVTVFAFVQIARNLNDVVGDDWPLKSFKIWTTPAHGALEVAVRSSSTIEESLRVIGNFGHVRGPYLVLKTHPSTSEVSLRFATSITSCVKVAEALTMTAMLSAVAMLDPMLDANASNVQIRLKRSEPLSKGDLALLLRRPVVFEQPHDELVIPAELLPLASPFHDPSLLASSLTVLRNDSLRLREGGTLASQITELLDRRAFGRLSADEAARELGLSRRTLTRRLGEHGLQYRAIQDGHLRERARRLLSDGSLSRSEKAEQLGFQDETSFSRACRRWF